MIVTYDLSQPLTIQSHVAIIHKNITRLPEAMWLSFNPIVSNFKGWSVNVLGYEIDPTDVTIDGSERFHAAWNGVKYRGNRDVEFEVHSRHAPIVVFDNIDRFVSPELYDLDFVSGGIHFNLNNNLWNTAFPMWTIENPDGQRSINMSFAMKFN